jgi:hypothetical protein
MYINEISSPLGQVPATLPVPCPPATCTPVGPFLASTHAFRFVNSFTTTIPLPFGLPAISPSYGLCGGMAAAALDYYLSCIPIPSTSSVPATGTTLFNYLFRRLLDSLGSPTFGMVTKFLTWTNRPDFALPGGLLTGGLIPGANLFSLDGTQELTHPEFYGTIATLTARPVPLGLVYVGPGAVNIWENHQVLAYGTSRVSPTVTDIKVYEPNYPLADDAVIRCEVLKSRVRCLERVPSRGVTKRVRGFFRMPYTRSIPPCLP